MSLIVHDTLSLNTQIGVCKIQLCLGDITKLAKEEEVDVLVVSAFPGDYSPTPSSLIGALAINLGINVRQLSKEKEEDLRKQYFCWWSKPLPEHHSFGRVLCFEGGFGSRGTKPPQVVGAVFRCLVPVLSGKDIKEGSVIMPLLASGDQGYSKRLMLKLLMDSAIHWIKAGLQLRTLKIVLFSRHPEKHDKSFEPLFSLFQEMNAKYGEQDLSYETELMFDVYMSHSPKDHDSAMKVAEFLKTERNVTVFHDFQELNDDESWQEEIFNIMGRCARVIALLSPGYLETESCIEQYNMALCINRRSHETVLAPFYITSLDYMPTYMSLIQYEDCRPKDSEKLLLASIDVAESLRSPQGGAISHDPTEKTSKTAQGYDVFISYSHCNKEHAYTVVEILQSLDADLNVFIDTEGLNTGTSWQQSLYSALDQSKSTIAFISPDYIKSKVCYEEFCLSYALYVDKHSSLDLVSLLVEPVDELPQWCVAPLPIDCMSTDEGRDQLITSVCADLVNRLRGKTTTPEGGLTERVENLKRQDITMESATDDYRKTCFVLRSNVLKTTVSLNANTDSSWRTGHSSDVLMSLDSHQVSAGTESLQEKPAETTSSEVTSSEVTSAEVTSSDVTSSAGAVTSSGTSSSQVTSSSLVCDVALSFAEADRKSAVILKQLLLEKMPGLVISEPMSGDIARVQSLDLARVIVPLLSPALLGSTELVEELNIAIYRNRGSSRRVLFPVQVAPFPLKPSYVHLIPCEVSRSDYKWASKVIDQDLNDDVMRMAEHHDIEVDVVFCLKTAADQISERLTGEIDEDASSLNRVLLSLHVVEEDWKQVQKVLRQEQGLETWKRAFGVEIQSENSGLEPSRVTREDVDEKPVTTSKEKANKGEKPEKNVRFEDDLTGDKAVDEGRGVELDLHVIETERENPVVTSSPEPEERATHEPLRPSTQQENSPATSRDDHVGQADDESRDSEQRETGSKDAASSNSESKSCTML